MWPKKEKGQTRMSVPTIIKKSYLFLSVGVSLFCFLMLFMLMVVSLVFLFGGGAACSGRLILTGFCVFVLGKTVSSIETKREQNCKHYCYKDTFHEFHFFTPFKLCYLSYF